MGPSNNTDNPIGATAISAESKRSGFLVFGAVDGHY